MGVSSLDFTPATAGENLIRFRIRSIGAPGTAADTEIVTPFKGRIKRVLIASDGNVQADFVADIITPQGTATGAIDWGDVGFANLPAGSVVETVFDPEDAALQVEAGDRVQISTTTGIVSVTSAYGWLIIG